MSAVIDPNVRAGMEVGMYSCEKSIRQMWMLNANSSLELFTTAIDTEATDGYMAKVRNLIIIIVTIIVTVIVTVIVIIFFLVWKIITNFHVYSTYAYKCIRHFKWKCIHYTEQKCIRHSTYNKCIRHST